MYRTAVSAVALLSLSAVPALAGPFDAVTLEYSGHATLGQFEASLTDDADYFDVEIDSQLTFGGGFGFAFGADITHDFFENYRDAYTYYGFYEFLPGHEVRVGVLPPPTDNIGPQDRIGYSEFIEERLAFLILESSISRILHDNEEPMIGIGYRGQMGAFNLEAAAQFINDPFTDYEVYSVAAWYDGMTAAGLSYRLGVGAENLNIPSVLSLQRYYAGINLSYRAFDLFVEASFGDSAFAPGEANTVDLSLRYTPEVLGLDGLAIGADYTRYQATDGTFGQELLGIGAEYTHASGLGVGVSAGRSTAGAFTEETVSFEAFFRF